MNNVKVTPENGVSTLTWTQTTGVVTGATHVFEVTAVNGRGESARSLPRSVIAATVPSPPLNLLIEDTASNFVHFSWSLPLSDGGSSILDYEVYWDEGDQDEDYVLLLSSTGNQLQFIKT
jgi:hypothetical protein